MEFIDRYRDHMFRLMNVYQRMTRGEFWPFVLINLIGLYALHGFCKIIGYDFIAEVVALAGLIVIIGPVVQRLNDGAYSLWFLLLIFVPYIGIPILLMLLIDKSYPATTRHGPCRA